MLFAMIMTPCETVYVYVVIDVEVGQAAPGRIPCNRDKHQVHGGIIRNGGFPREGV